jgi:hypothetical protein
MPDIQSFVVINSQSIENSCKNSYKAKNVWPGTTFQVYKEDIEFCLYSALVSTACVTSRCSIQDILTALEAASSSVFTVARTRGLSGRAVWDTESQGSVPVSPDSLKDYTSVSALLSAGQSPGYRSRGPGSISGAIRYSEK